jgi:hypothetical protein
MYITKLPHHSSLDTCSVICHGTSDTSTGSENSRQTTMIWVDLFGFYTVDDDVFSVGPATIIRQPVVLVTRISLL